jgi:DNA-binding transcriptional ArsR family regulator
MVERQASLLDGTYGALAHSVRRELMDALRVRPASVSDLAAPFDMSLAAISKHIGVLEDARLVSKTPLGRARIVTLEPTPLVGAREWIDSYLTYWEERLDALEAHLVQGRS